MPDDDADDELARELYEAGRAAMQTQDLDSAVTHLEASVAAFPHFKALELLGEALLARGEPRKALVPLAAATTLNAQVRAPSMLAEALLAIGDHVQAHRVAQLALSRDPSNKKALAVVEATKAAYEAWALL